jgi:hypothetical protein
MSSLRQITVSLIALAAMASAAHAAPVAQVVRLSGNAEITRGNATGPLVLGAALEPGDKIKTDGSGRLRLQLIDGSTINLGSQSELVIDDVVSQGPGTERQIELDLATGALRAEAAPATPKSRFEIRTPLAVTAVRGTEWGIVSAAERSDVIILSGRVGVRRNIVSGESAISLTRSLGTSVTAEGLGPVGRWSPEQLAAFDALTAVPGTETPFDLGAAPGLNLTPIALPPREITPQKYNNCLDPENLNCRTGGRDRRDHQSEGHDNEGHDHESSGSNGNSF